MTLSRHYIMLALATLLFATSSSQLLAQGRSIPKTKEAQAQAEAEEEISEELPEGQKYRYRLINGLNLSVDIIDPILHLASFDHASYEVQAMLDLHHRFFPMVTFGMGMADETSDNGNDYGTDQKQECNFKSDYAPFAKVGLAYNTKYNSTKPNDYYMLFCRYGLAMSKADITNLYYADDLWGASGPISITGQEYTTHWLEVGGMLKVQIAGRLAMGWDLYWKIKLAQSGTSQGEPYFVPGMGTTKSNFGFSFRIYYDIF